MLKNKRIKIIALLSLSALALVGCSKDEKKLPTDFEDNLFDMSAVNNPDVDGNDKEHYYSAVSSESEIHQKALDEILVNISKVAHGYKDDSVKNHDVSEIVKEHEKVSVSDNYQQVASDTSSESNLTRRAKKSISDVSKNGNYSKDNLFYENKFAQYLNDSFYYLDVDMDKVDHDGRLVTPQLEFDDVFSKCDFYDTYMEHEYFKDMRINYLTSEYIYNKSYASIGNSNARKVQIVSLTDRSDEPGAAKKLLNAYIKDYVLGDKVDDDFYTLSRLWKGITKDTADSIQAGRYGSEIVLTAEEENWLRENDILPSGKKFDAQSSGTLLGKVLSDKEKLDAGKDDYFRVDSSLESTYTGSYTYDIDTGVRKAVDDIATKNLVTSGIYLSSSGISGIPSALSTRIFSPKISTDKTEVDKMKADPTYKKDITVYHNGYRYLTVADTLTGTNDDIIYYDADSKTYYLTRLLDVVDTNALSTSSSSNSIYDTAEKKEQIAREVAYTMSTTGSYKNNSIVYWLSRTKLNFSDEDFMKWLNDNYKDIFKKDNPYSKEEKIVLE